MRILVTPVKLRFSIPRILADRLVRGESTVRPFPWALRGLIAALVLPVLLTSAGVGLAQTVDPNMGTTNGPVYAIVTDGTTIYVGGNFTRAANGDGYWEPRNNLAAFDAATGAFTPWNPNANGTVGTLALNGNTVYVGGQFSSIGGQPRSQIAALDATSGAVTSWNPNATGSTPQGQFNYTGVSALAVSGSTVYAGGYFSGIGGQPRLRIAALDAATGAATAWAPAITSEGFPSSSSYGPYVRSLAVDGGTVYVSGYFAGIGTPLQWPRPYFAALDAATGATTAWQVDSGINGFAYSLIVSGNTVYAGGDFQTIGGQTRNGLAALDAVTGAVTAWDPHPSYRVIRALAVSGNTVYVGGFFRSIGGQPRSFVGAVDVATGAATPWSADVDSSYYLSGVYALAVSGNTVYVGGDFNRIGGQDHSNFAAVSADDTPVAVDHSGTPSLSDLRLLSPNPTSGGAQLQYSVARSGRVRLEVLDVSGRVQETLADRIHTPGRYDVTWDGADRRGRVSPGLYFIRLMTPDQVTMRKLAIIQ